MLANGQPGCVEEYVVPQEEHVMVEDGIILNALEIDGGVGLLQLEVMKL